MKYGEEFYTDQYGRNYWTYYLSRYVVKCEFRRGPIPGTGSKDWGTRTSVLRHMKTTQERKWSFADPEYTRAARNKSHIPNHWDDHDRSDHNNKSWKHCKKKRQWM